jgi:hypothetical protein
MDEQRVGSTPDDEAEVEGHKFTNDKAVDDKHQIEESDDDVEAHSPPIGQPPVGEPPIS